MEGPWGGVETSVMHNQMGSHSRIVMHGKDEVLWVPRQTLGHANTRIAVGSRRLVFGPPQKLRWLFDYVGCRSIVINVSAGTKLELAL
jgi:hypothetical protein